MGEFCLFKKKICLCSIIEILNSWKSSIHWKKNFNSKTCFLLLFSVIFFLLLPYYKHWIQVQVYYITSQSISVFSAFFRKNFSCNVSVPFYYFNKTTILLMSYTISGHLTICLLVCVCVYVFLRRCRVDRYLNFFFKEIEYSILVDVIDPS